MIRLLLAVAVLYSASGLAAESSPESNGATQAPSSAISSNEQHQRAQRAMQGGDYAIAYCIWHPMAQQGDVEAQFNLGWMYHNGYGLAIDNRETLEWWRQAAQQGHANAAFALGMLLSKGDEQVARNLPQALNYYLEAASLGHQDARQMLLHLIDEEQETVVPLLANGNPARLQLLGPTLTVSGTRANARAAPGTSYRVLAVLDEGTEVIRLAQRRRWVKVFQAQHGLVAWIHESLLRQ